MKPSVCALFVAVALLGGCSHFASQDRFSTKSQLVILAGCQKLSGLKAFEKSLFKNGFVREVTRDGDPVPFEILENFVSGQHKLVTFTKSDFEAVTSGSEPYTEVVNHYKIAACEEPGGALYLVFVRYDLSADGAFLGARMKEALAGTGCTTSTVAAVRDLGNYQNATEDDLVLHIGRGRCRDFALDR